MHAKGDETSVGISIAVEITPTTDYILEGSKVLQEPPQIDQSWASKMYVDRATNSLGAGASTILKNPKGSF